MTPLEQALERPEFGSIELGIGAEETDDHIEETIKGLATSEAEEGVLYRTRDGMLVAIVSPSDDGATLAYRTAPPSESATRKASKLLEALRPYAVEE